MLAKVGVEAEVVHVTDLNEIVSRGILVTPAVVVDGVKKVEGKVPSEGEIRRWVGSNVFRAWTVRTSCLKAALGDQPSPSSGTSR